MLNLRQLRNVLLVFVAGSEEALSKVVTFTCQNFSSMEVKSPARYNISSAEDSFGRQETRCAGG